MTLRSAIVAAMLAAVLALPASAFAATGSATNATGSATTTYYPASPMAAYVTTTSGNTSLTVTYDLSWTLPTAGKSGCTVCHGDPDLVRIQGGKTVSLYVSTAVLQASAHKNVPCTACHVDFAYTTPHPTAKDGNAWRLVAKAACKNCHVNEFTDYSSSSHSPSRLTGQNNGLVGGPNSSAAGKPKPLCGDCHGGHSIPASNNVEAQKVLHLTGQQMCGQCHTKDSGSYLDYYHGAAYKMSAPDAPACWDCHNTHNILPSTDRQSTTYPDRLPDTCHKCHQDPRDGYTSYVAFVHNKQALYDANPLYRLIKQGRTAVDAVVARVKSLFTRSSS